MMRSETGLKADAARKRLTRIRPPLFKFPVDLLPKGEGFYYNVKDRTSEVFWTNLHRDLRDTESVYGAALDALSARGGTVSLDEFPVISGAPVKQLRQVPSDLVLTRLQVSEIVRVGLMEEFGEVVTLIGYNARSTQHFRARQMADIVLLDGVREWARNLGMASYNQIVIRGDSHPRMVGQYKWDMTAPSYLHSLQRTVQGKSQQGFFVADVFASEVLDEYGIRYFIRKVKNQAATGSGTLMPMLVALGYTPEAYTLGHRNGLVMATPTSLFGSRVGTAFNSLVATLKNAAAIVASEPKRLVSLLEDLKDISGRAGNLRGILFELICAFLVRHDGNWVEMGKRAPDEKSNKYYDVDVICTRGSTKAVLYECKGGEPGHIVSKSEVEDWLRRIPAFAAYAKTRMQPDADISLEIWTSGTFHAEALRLLEYEKSRRTKQRIDYKDGAAVRAVGVGHKDKAITDAIDEHFFRHPMSR